MWSGLWRRFVLAQAFVGCATLVAGQTPATEPRSETVFVVDGLTAPAEILVDQWGVPHLYAATADDVYFLQGLNAARDRLWQLDLWKRRGEGTLAEVLGPSKVEHDRAARLLLYRGDMYAEWLAYASDTKRIVGAFVRGINAYITLTEEQPELLPLEFRQLGYRPSQWTPETVVKIRSHGLLRNVRSEVRRARRLRDHGPELLALTDRLEPAHELTVPEGLDPSAFPDGVLATYDLGTSSVKLGPSTEPKAGEAPDSEQEREPPEANGELDAWAEGSNNWAVAGARTASGRPILADDPHRTLSVPSLRYIAHLSAPGLDVIGAGEPALPGVSIGHNGSIAFGLTIFGIDQEDLYVYRTHPDNPDLYQYRDRFEAMVVVTESIPVRGADPVEVELRFTRHGPVLHRDLASHRAYALRAAWLEPGMAPYLGSIEYMRAGDWDQFLAAMNRWGAPSENQVYADTAGNIGWKPGGRTPVRRGWDGLLPVPGDGRYEWDGYRDMDELPMEYNPSRGWVATANQMNLPAGFDRPTGYEWATPFRYRRIVEVLSENTPMTIARSVDLQTDYLSLPARRLTPLLAAVDSKTIDDLPEEDSRRVRAAIRELVGWDHRLDPESGMAALFEIWWQRHLPPAVMELVLGDPGYRRARPDAVNLLQELESPTHPGWRRAQGDDSREPIAVIRDQVLIESLHSALVEIRQRLGEKPSEWRWGDLHRAYLNHPVAGRVDESTARQLEIADLARGGSGDTPGNTGYDRETFRQVSGASFRLVIDVGAWDRSVAMNSPGQSGDPRSPHYQDLFGPWSRDEAFPLLYSREAVEAATRQRFVVRPRPD